MQDSRSFNTHDAFVAGISALGTLAVAGVLWHFLSPQIEFQPKNKNIEEDINSEESSVKPQLKNTLEAQLDQLLTIVREEKSQLQQQNIVHVTKIDEMQKKIEQQNLALEEKENKIVELEKIIETLTKAAINTQPLSVSSAENFTSTHNSLTPRSNTEASDSELYSSHSDLNAASTFFRSNSSNGVIFPKGPVSSRDFGLNEEKSRLLEKWVSLSKSKNLDLSEIIITKCFIFFLLRYRNEKTIANIVSDIKAALFDGRNIDLDHVFPRIKELLNEKTQDQFIKKEFTTEELAFFSQQLGRVAASSKGFLTQDNTGSNFFDDINRLRKGSITAVRTTEKSYINNCLSKLFPPTSQHNVKK